MEDVDLEMQKQREAFAPAPDDTVAPAVVAAAPEPEFVESAVQRVEDAVQEVEAVIVQDLHRLEQRCFGRPGPDHPMLVTTVTGANNG